MTYTMQALELIGGLIAISAYLFSLEICWTVSVVCYSLASLIRYWPSSPQNSTNLPPKRIANP